jgi:hypothetical protein
MSKGVRRIEASLDPLILLFERGRDICSSVGGDVSNVNDLLLQSSCYTLPVNNQLYSISHYLDVISNGANSISQTIDRIAKIMKNIQSEILYYGITVKLSVVLSVFLSLLAVTLFFAIGVCCQNGLLLKMTLCLGFPIVASLTIICCFFMIIVVIFFLFI